MIKKLGLSALLCILVVFLIYLVNPGFIDMFSEMIPPTTNIPLLGDIGIWFIIEIIGIVIGTFIGSKIVSFSLRKIFDKTPFPEKIENTITNLSKYVTWVIGFFILLGVIGVDLTSVVVGIGAFSIAISFAMKDIIQNLVSGILLHADKPFKVGDSIKIKNHGGVVQKISIRSTTLREDDGDLVMIPNTMFVTNPVKRYKEWKKLQKG